MQSNIKQTSDSEHVDAGNPAADQKRTCFGFQAAPDLLPPAANMDLDMGTEGEEFA